MSQSLYKVSGFLASKFILPAVAGVRLAHLVGKGASRPAQIVFCVAIVRTTRLRTSGLPSTRATSVRIFTAPFYPDRIDDVKRAILQFAIIELLQDGSLRCLALFPQGIANKTAFLFLGLQGGGTPQVSLVSRTIMNSAAWPRSVCSVTHGAILRSAAACSGPSAEFTAREEATAPSATATAPARSRRPRMRRRDPTCARRSFIIRTSIAFRDS